MKPKFRAKTLGSNEWVYGSYITMFTQSKLSETTVNHYIYDGITYHIIDITTLCQYVGIITEINLNKVKGFYTRTFKDVDLYIGDIVEGEVECESVDGFSHSEYAKYLVEWNEENWSVGFRYIQHNGELCNELYSLDDIDLASMWLIGNKFDTKNFNYK
jgi:hypothetical protein